MTSVGAPLSEAEIEARLPLWRALSDLFLDTELQGYHYKYLAKVVLESGLKPAEVQRILWNEVFPALADNLRIATGEWSGFQDDWLRERILNVLSGRERRPGTYGLISVAATRAVIAETWAKACSYLPPEYRDAADVI